MVLTPGAFRCGILTSPFTKRIMHKLTVLLGLVWFFAGLSVLEASIAMGRQEGTIRGLQFRAIASLRRSLGIEAAPATASASAASVVAATIQVLR